MQLRLLSSAFCLTLLAASQAQAHVRFVYPTPRYETPAQDNGEMIKDPPCGNGADTRTTDETRITVFQPGETITIQFTETIEHPGHYRVAFDNDGQDAFVTPLAQTDVQQTPVLPVLADGIDDVPNQHDYEVTVTLPTEPCENCTLQVIQVMTTAADWTADDIYFTCADIAIRGAGGTGGTGGMPAGGAGGSGGGSAGSATSGAGGTGGAVATGGTGGAVATGGTGASTGGAGGGGGTGNVPLVTAPSNESSGCSVRGPSSSGDAAAALVLLGLLGAAGRRRRR